METENDIWAHRRHTEVMLFIERVVHIIKRTERDDDRNWYDDCVIFEAPITYENIGYLTTL